MIGQYNPLQWPPDLQVALNHEAASSIGKRNQKKQGTGQCPCCSRDINQEPYNFIQVDVARELSFEHGTAAGGCFSMIKYYIAAMLLIAASTSVFFIYIWYDVCDYSEKHPEIQYQIDGKYGNMCSKQWLNLLYFTGSEQIIFFYTNVMASESRLTAWRWMMFTNFMIIIVVQSLVDIYYEFLDQLYGKKKSPLASKTLLINYVPPSMNVEELKNYILKLTQKTTKVGVTIEDLFFVSNYSQYFDHFNNRTNLYCQVRPFYLKQYKDKLTDKQIKQQQQLEQKLQAQYFQLQDAELIVKEGKNYGGKAFITLSSHFDALQVRQAFQSRGCFYHVQLFTFKLLAQIGFCSDYFKKQIINKDQIYGSFAPEPNDIKWENIGISSTEKMGAVWLAFVFTIISVVICSILLTMVTLLKEQLLVLIGAIIIVQIYAVLIQIIANKRKVKTNSSKSYFILSKNSFFHLLFLILIPTLYYAFQTTEQPERGLKLFGTVIIFNLLILVSTIWNVPLIMKEKQKRKLLEQKQWKKFCQQELNQIFQRLEFPIEMVFLNVSKLWSFAALQAFTCPYTVLFCAIFLFIYYWIVKYQLINQFTIIEFKSVNIQQRYLRWYSIVFQFFILFLFGAVINFDPKPFYIACSFYLAVVAFELYKIQYPLFVRKGKRKSEIQEGIMDQSKGIEESGEQVSYSDYYQTFKTSLIDYNLQKLIEHVVNHQTEDEKEQNETEDDLSISYLDTRQDD